MEDRHYTEHTYTHKYNGNEGGTSDYNELFNLPTINGHTVISDKTGAEYGLASSEDIPTKLSELQNDENFITDADIPTKVSDLQNDSGFITLADVPTKVSELQNDEGYINDTDFNDLFTIKGWFLSTSFTAPLDSIITGIQTALGTVLAALENNEYITLEQVIITNLVNLVPERKAILKKGDTVPVYRLQGCSFGTNEIVFVDVNNANIVHYGTAAASPSQDYNDNYTGDIQLQSVQLLYNKYQKGV